VADIASVEVGLAAFVADVDVAAVVAGGVEATPLTPAQ